MLTALDAPSDHLDEADLRFVGQIREHGWFRTNVLGDEQGPGFSYTTGFWVHASHPELIIFNTKPEIAHNVFWTLYRDAKAGKPLPVGIRTDAPFENLPAVAFHVARNHYPDFLGWSRWFYGGDDFPCLQIVWPDRAGRFPWEPHFDPTFEEDQPDLTKLGWLNELVD
jgi:hypothetical protein